MIMKFTTNRGYFTIAVFATRINHKILLKKNPDLHQRKNAYLGSDLVAALASLEMDNFTHFLLVV